MRVGIATVQVPFVRGGAELLAESLQAALEASGHDAEIITMPFKWYPAMSVADHMLAAKLMCIDGEVGRSIDRLICLKFPAYLFPHRSKRLWLLHQHRSAYDLWDTSIGDLVHSPAGSHVQNAIWSADNSVMQDFEAVYTISKGVSDRLFRFNGVASEPLYHPPPGADRLHPGAYGDYVLFPSRLNEGKRQYLALEAMTLTREPVRLCFMGTGDSPDYERRLRLRSDALGLGDRVEWRGRVSETEKLALYSHCLSVLFPPFDEDYGYITLEAMMCAKAVITTSDSGGPLDFVSHENTGLVCAPTPQSIASGLDRLWANRLQTQRWGEAGRQSYADMKLSWSHVLDCLL